MQNKQKIIAGISILAGLTILLFIFFHNKEESKVNLRLGYFPNISHAQALIGVSEGIFQKTLGNDIVLSTKTFNAGPSEIEALFAGEIDIGYIGPSPAINGYVKSNGQALKIIAGSASGGASLIIQPELVDKFNDGKILIGKKVVTPQQGNTQDVSLRHYLREKGLFDKVNILPIANPEQLSLFKQKEIAGAWAPEPWATRLVKEAGGVRIIDERDLWKDKMFCVSNIIVSGKFLKDHPEIVVKFLKAHLEITQWLNDNPEQAKLVVNNEIEKITSNKISIDVLNEAWTMFDFTFLPLQETVFEFADWAYVEGFLGKNKPDLKELYDLNYLDYAAN
ncbi:MAG TPA: ABC transporter substrate-binding protein [Candidatus Magasanikbacteria bacterium]|nr:ABC transporter substrate-binding protein [Candidatus Magasanikbacteria bacterium]